MTSQVDSEHRIASFPPVVGGHARVLILGSMPGVRSLAANQYYAYPHNAFWFIMGELCLARQELPYLQRCDRLRQAGIALWDVLKYCARVGSLDSQIQAGSETPNELDDFLRQHATIRLVCFNGKKAVVSFNKLVLPTLAKDILQRISLQTLPSTSPANTSLTRAEKLLAWKQAVAHHLL